MFLQENLDCRISVFEHVVAGLTHPAVVVGINVPDDSLTFEILNISFQLLDLGHLFRRSVV